MNIYRAKFIEVFYSNMVEFFREKIVEPPLEPILHPSSKRIFWFGLLTFIGHPLFLWLWGDFLPQPYENTELRVVISLLGIILMLPYINRDPHSLKASISFVAVFFIQMPLFFTWMYLCNSGNAVWLATISMMILIWYHLTDWRLATVGLGLGSGIAWLLFKIIAPQTVALDRETLLTNTIVIAFSFCMAVSMGALSANTRQLIKRLSNREREQALIALAGSIAHEMRNPLGHIRYAADGIISSFAPPPTAESEQVISAKAVNKIYHHLAQIFTAITRGLQVIDITLQEVANKPIDPANFEYLSAANATEKALEEYNFDTVGDSNKVALHILNDFTFRGEETTYIYVIFNLIKNALYYFPSHPNATITITVDRQTITVTDTGPGIPLHILNSLFKNFATSDKKSGTGLGLAYCYRAMQAFGGEISCTSIVGQFTTFTLKFPAIAQEEISKHAKHVFQQALPLLSNKRLLIVDDQAIYHALICQMLEGLNCNVDTAPNGQRAIDMLKTKHYDLIIMDLCMAGKDGYATTNEIRAGGVPHQKNITIVAHTAESPYMAKIKARKVGMDGFIRKPCTQLELIQALCRGLDQRTPEQDDDSLAGKTVLIVDDELINRQYLEVYAQEWGMHALHAENGQTALEVLKKTSCVDVVLMDMEMPLMNGVEATQRIRATPTHKHLIIVALTGNSGEQFVEETRMSGMNDFVTKPFNRKVLRQKLVRLITARDQQYDAPFHTKLDSRTIESVIDPEIDALTDSLANRYNPEYQSQKPFFKDMPLIDYAQLASFQSNFNNKFQEFLQRFLNNLVVRNEDLKTGIKNNDMGAILKALHSLVGAAGYVGAHALRQYIKLRLYSAVGAGHMPEEEAWAETVHVLVKETVNTLQERYLSIERK
jgi:CheY-like chemotaxis protein